MHPKWVLTDSQKRKRFKTCFENRQKVNFSFFCLKLNKCHNLRCNAFCLCMFHNEQNLQSWKYHLVY
jgi:hypothetical protein